MMNFINRNKYAVIFCALLLAGGYGGYKYYVSSQTPATTVKTGVVERGDLVETISATGALSAVNNVDISSKITGRIVEVLVEENQHVKAGDVLVRLDDTALMATMRQMKAKLDNAEANYNRFQKLVESGAISRSEYDNVYADYLVASEEITLGSPQSAMFNFINNIEYALEITEKEAEGSTSKFPKTLYTLNLVIKQDDANKVKSLLDDLYKYDFINTILYILYSTSLYG